MPWSGGTYTRNNGTYSGSTVWQSDAAAAVKIRADRHDTHDQDLATGINNCLTKDGQNSPTQNMSWGGFKITSLGNGTATTDAAAYGQTITALAWSGATITGTRAVGNLTITVTSGNITSALGYTPVNKAGDTMTGSLGFSGASLRLSGDFSNATVASRVLLQTSTANSTTDVGAIPSGTGTIAQHSVYNSSDPDNSSGFLFRIEGAKAVLRTLGFGTGTALPIEMIIGSTTYMKVETTGATVTGALTVSGAATIGGGKKLSKITLSSAAPGALADGELYLRY